MTLLNPELQIHAVYTFVFCARFCHFYLQYSGDTYSMYFSEKLLALQMHKQLQIVGE